MSNPRRKKGSALLIALILVLLLAIIGTGFLSVTSNERVSAKQNADNTQVDLLVDGTIGMVKATLVADLFSKQSAPTEVMPTDDATWSFYTGYYGYSSYSTSSKAWLAARVPVDYPGSTPNPKTAFDRFNWNCITWLPHLGEQQQTVGAYRGLVNPVSTATSYLWSANVKTMSATIDGVDYPAFKSTRAGNVEPFVAADTDADGIADAAYFPLMFQPRDGITYLAAVRIIDNAAALNVNTAWTRDYDLDSAGNPIPNEGFFRSGIGLRELLTSSNRDNEVAAVNAYRMGGTNTANTTAYDETGTPRTDFQWYSQGEALSANLGARIGNPGINGNTRYRPYTSLDDTALAYRFVLINPEVAPTPIEQSFLAAGTNDSLFRAAPNYNSNAMNVWKEYSRRRDANGNYTENHLELITRWFGDNFDYDNGKFSLRPLLVANNSVSQVVPAARIYSGGDQFNRVSPRTLNPGMLAYRTQGDWQSGQSYGLHDLVRYNSNYYVSNKSNNTSSPTGTFASTDEWDYQPWSSTVQKASLNTSTFRELWRTFWSICAISSTGTLMVTDDHPPSSTGSYSSPAAPEFRWSTRRPGPLKATVADERSQDMVQLRTALAALNTIGLRDARRDVYSRTITLYRQGNTTTGGSSSSPPPPPNYGTPVHRVNIFSQEWQPVISEIVIDTENPDAFLAVELYNPYPDAISLKNWHFAKAARSTTGMTLTDIGEISASGALSIPANSYVTLHSGNLPADVAAQMAINVGIGQHTLPKLAEAIGQELVLVRPRRADGTLTQSSREIDFYDEGTDLAPNLHHFAPVDQMDLTLIPSGGTDVAGIPNKVHRYRYARDTIAPDQWKFFFPGRYDPIFNQSQSSGFIYDGLKATPNDAGNLGGADASTYARTARIKIQLPSWPGKNKIGSNTPDRYPFGMFARVGDVLRVTSIGAYSIFDLTGTSLTEMTSVTMDAAMCDVDTTNTTGVPGAVPINLGRFIPSDWVKTGGSNAWINHYSMKSFDYFTVRRPMDDFAPNVSPGAYGYYQTNAAGVSVWVQKPTPDPIPNTDPSRANVDEPVAADQGLLNINTAPWQVLASLPLVVNPNGTIDHARTRACARTLTEYNWSSTSIQRPIYRWTLEAMDELLRANTIDDPNDPNDGVDAIPPDDWETRFEPMMRISNLVTVRSDSFTCYIVVEGWRDCYTPNAKRVLQRRVAFIADRSAVTENNRDLRITNIPIR